jgi:hypothetical protein
MERPLLCNEYISWKDTDPLTNTFFFLALRQQNGAKLQPNLQLAIQ